MRLIDADALIDFFSNIQVELGAYRIGFKAVNRAIDAQPTIEPKRGEWIDEGRNLWGCSNCGMEIYSESERDRNEFHKWCSRCGARMKGADDE